MTYAQDHEDILFNFEEWVTDAELRVHSLHYKHAEALRLETEESISKLDGLKIRPKRAGQTQEKGKLTNAARIK